MDQKAIDRIRKLAEKAASDPEARRKLWKRTNEYLGKRKAEHPQRVPGAKLRPAEGITDPSYQPRPKKGRKP